MILMDDIEKMWKLFDQFGPKAVGLRFRKKGTSARLGKLKPSRCFLTDVWHGSGAS